MRDPESMLETEIKLAVPDLIQVLHRLDERGFSVLHPRTLERNTVFDTAGNSLRSKRHLLRLREYGGERVVTFKGPPIVDVHRTREEIEFLVSDAAACARVLESLDFAPVFRYEKYRTAFSRPHDPGHVLLDETPIGVFLELEGTPLWIDEVASELGYTTSEYLTQSYGALYGKYCAEHNVVPTDMTFGLSNWDSSA